MDMDSIKIPKTQLFVLVNEQIVPYRICNEQIIIQTDIMDIKKVNLLFYDLENDKFNRCIINKYIITKNKIVIDMKLAQKVIDRIIKQLELPEKNLKEKNNSIGKLLIKYPVNNDLIFETDIKKIKNKINKDLKIEFQSFKYNDILKNIECAICYNSNKKIMDFLNDKHNNDDTFEREYIEKYVSRVYVGNAFCWHKNINIDTLYCIVEKCNKKNFKLSIITSVLPEHELASFYNVLFEIDNLNKNGSDIEIIVNDFGSIHLCKKFKNTKMVWGVMLNRRQKDPRYCYRWIQNNKKGLLRENDLNVNFQNIKDYLHNFNRIEYEHNVIGNVYSVNRCSLHFPFSQTNTSMYCPLYAAIKNKDSNRQVNVEKCKEYCNEYFYVLGQHLNLIGIGNGLCSFYTSNIINEIKNNPSIDRIIYTPL
ncbi:MULTISPECIES: hypothetical protein [Blautia]|uniref:hypothetical protein n=1 Tax=Blautia TaxID=572511 RepID=UPI000BA3D607|nr:MULTISPECIES: hypothetical protein [Blautia]